MRPFAAAAVTLLAVATVAADQVEPPVRTSAPPLTLELPRVALAGLTADVGITLDESLPGPVPFELWLDGTPLLEGELQGETELSVEVPVPEGGGVFEIRLPDRYLQPHRFTLRSIPGWLTLVPPALAILMALVLRQVIPALFAGIWLGGWIVYGGLLTGFLRTLDGYLVGAVADADHAAIILFSMLLGGMVGVISRAGGMAGLVDALSRQATSPRRGQFFTWLIGLLVFFDDYANTLVVGNTMRPVTDRLRISREKLAYIVDSTAAPVASIALVSTWIGFEVSLIGDALVELDSPREPYVLFVRSIPHFFYPILALGFVLMVALSRRDFGPMLAAERRAERGELLAPTAVPLADFDSEALQPDDGRPRRWYNAIVPVAVVLTVTFVSQYLTGRAAIETLPEGGFLKRFGAVFSEGNSFHSLLYAAVCGAAVAMALAWSQRILSLGAALRALVEGMKTMFMAFVILTLAWGIGAVCGDLGTADFVVSILTGALDPAWLPFLIFVFAAAISFSTGSSWSTMSILVPLAVPAAFGVAQQAGYDAAQMDNILLGAVASVLAGSIFGDHCSPISDTTILSSMASACDHVDHVRTQLPYALVVGIVSVVVCSIPVGFGASIWLMLPLAFVILWIVLRLFGRPAR